MRGRDYALVVAGWLLTGLAAAPLAGQTPSTASDETRIPPNVPTLVFDVETNRYEASPGEEAAPFSFHLTNVWTNEIIIDSVSNSCGCTTVSLPSTPWRLPPGGSGEIRASVNLAAKWGLITKTLTNYYRLMPDNISNIHVLYLVVNRPPPPAVAGKMSEAERNAAMNRAKADAQAIFKGGCARCHADRGRNAFGEELYAVDCGICHESSHRASLVPDLHALKQPANFDYWKTIITLGKPHTMMPAFAATQGGPLTEAQIMSLATYLNHVISHNFSPVKTNGANAPLTRAASLP